MNGQEIIVHSTRQCQVATMPLVITSDASPTGNYSVRIVTSPGVEDTVSYIIRDTAESTSKPWVHFQYIFSCQFQPMSLH